MRRLVPVVVPVVVLGLLLSACSSTDDPPASGAPEPSTSSEDASSTATPSASESSQPDQPASPVQPPHPVSIEALAQTDFNGGRLRIGEEVARTGAHTQYAVSWRSGDLRVSGRLAVPRGDGPFPVAVLAHGYIDPAIYVNGQGMTRERAWLGDRGYVTLHVDYRGHAESDPDPSGGLDMRMGYSEDVINAVLALQEWDGPVDDDRVAIIGRSMGGAVVYNALAARPGLVDAGVVFASVSSNAVENFDRWIRNDPGRSAIARQILGAHGEPRDNPAFWDGISSRTHFDDVTEPVLIHHGTADDTCPIRWSRQSARAMRAAGVDVTLEVYAGEGHAFGPQFEQSMQRTARFLEQHLA